MKLASVRPSALSQKSPLAVVLLPKDEPGDLGKGELFERAASLMRRKVFEAKAGKTLLLHADEGTGGPAALLLVGLGPRDALSPETWRRAGAIAGATAADEKVSSLVVGTSAGCPFDERSLAAVAEGLVASSYRYKLKKDDAPPPARAKVAHDVKGGNAVLTAAAALAEAVNLARELGDLPGNVATPGHLKRTAETVCRQGRLRFKAYDEAALRRMKMGGILAVSQGSAEKPWLLEMEWKPARPKATVVVVGKGLTFDSGGISIKPAAHMEEMKYDMCGAAATIGLMKAIAASRPKHVRVVGLVGTTENMNGSRAYKPGDVVTTASGTTIEVINTDAEGRIVLADALHHARRFQPDAVIDLATLTGAIVVALGGEAAGLFCKDDALAQRLLEASSRTGERLWRMPTYGEYGEAVKGRWGDVKNSAGREGGACTAAAFLFRFTEGLAHAHVDIAGTAWSTRSRPGAPDGASGFGVRLLHDALLGW